MGERGIYCAICHQRFGIDDPYFPFEGPEVCCDCADVYIDLAMGHAIKSTMNALQDVSPKENSLCP